MKREDKIGYGILAFVVVIGVPIFLYLIFTSDQPDRTVAERQNDSSTTTSAATDVPEPIKIKSPRFDGLYCYKNPSLKIGGAPANGFVRFYEDGRFADKIVMSGEEVPPVESVSQWFKHDPADTMHGTYELTETKIKTTTDLNFEWVSNETDLIIVGTVFGDLEFKYYQADFPE